MTQRAEACSCETWQDLRLSEIGRVFSGATPSTSTPENWDGPIAWVTPADLSKLRTRRLSSTRRTLTEKGLASCAAKHLPPQSLVVSSRAPIGHMALPVMGFCTNQGCKSIEFFDGQHPDFHYYNLRFWVRRLHDKGEGTTFSEISKTAFENVVVPVPVHRKVQESIARVLAHLDEAIERTEALLAKQQRIRIGLMYDLLTRGVDARGCLRHHSTHRFKNTVLGLIPEEWEARSLAEVVPSDRPIVYGILMPGKHFEGGVPVIKVKDIQDGAILSGGLLKTDPKIDAAYRRSRVREGDLLFTIRGSVGRMAIVTTELDGANITQDTARITVVNANTSFVRHCLEMPKQRAFIDLHTVGQAVKGINLRDVRRIMIQFPQRWEQDEIARRLDISDDGIKTLLAEGKKLRCLQMGLMQDLLTGRVPISPLISEFKALVQP